MILDCKKKTDTSKKDTVSNVDFASDSCYRRRVSIHIAAGLRRYYAEQSPCAIYIQSILMAMLWSHCRYRLHGLSQKQMEYRR